MQGTMTTDTSESAISTRAQSEPTPGPWVVERGSQTDRIYGIKGITRWNFLLKGASAQSQANARLIAAAPDMLAALEQIASLMGGQLPDYARAAHDIARAAIARATGAAS